MSIKSNIMEFQKLFGEILSEEVVLECNFSFISSAYSCALQREILAQGRLFITTKRVAFHANIIGWITNVLIIFSLISSQYYFQI
jgi:hypothetical protein